MKYSAEAAVTMGEVKGQQDGCVLFHDLLNVAEICEYIEVSERLVSDETADVVDVVYVNM
jgi:hypothetical protein